MQILYLLYGAEEIKGFDSPDFEGRPFEYENCYVNEPLFSFQTGIVNF